MKYRVYSRIYRSNRIAAVKDLKSKKGSMIVEGAIFIPVFVVAAVVLVCLVKACWLQILVFNAAADQIKIAAANEMSVSAYGVSSELEDSGVDSSGLTLRSGGSVTVAGIPDIQRIDFSYDSRIALPVSNVKSIFLDNRILSRKWTGKDIEGTAFGFEAMERDEDADEVYVFPRSGGRYHSEGCRYVQSYAEKTVLSANIRKKYDACPLCTEGDEYDGQQIYIFRYGNSYHEADCHSVTKYVIRMDRRDAELKSYTSCSVCGG